MGDELLIKKNDLKTAESVGKRKELKMRMGLMHGAGYSPKTQSNAQKAELTQNQIRHIEASAQKFEASRAMAGYVSHEEVKRRELKQRQELQAITESRRETFMGFEEQKKHRAMLERKENEQRQEALQKTKESKPKAKRVETVFDFDGNPVSDPERIQKIQAQEKANLIRNKKGLPPLNEDGQEF